MNITIDHVRAAHTRIRRFIHRTPIQTCQALSDLAGCSLFLKCENLQKTGSFKARGAHNAVFSLDDESASRGVTTHSSGNHGQALALAARSRQIPATIVMPRNAPDVKRSAVAGYGASIVLCENTLESRDQTTAEVIQETGAYLIHPFDDPRIIAGQGTAAVEILEDIRDLDIIVAPVGGGGLLSGTLIAAKAIQPNIKVYAGEPELADDAYRSWKSGSIQPLPSTATIADGLRTTLGALTFPIIRDSVDGILTVSEDSIIRAMQLIWERAKLVVEPSGAVPFATVLEHPSVFRNQRVGLILSGGNVDLQKLPF